MQQYWGEEEGRGREGWIFVLPQRTPAQSGAFGSCGLLFPHRCFPELSHAEVVPQPPTWGTDQHLGREEADLRLDSQGMGMRGCVGAG